MTNQQFAASILGLLPRASVPVTMENAQAAIEIYETLGAIVRGELILAKSVPTAAPKE